MIDSHAHLAMFPAAERSEVLARAHAAGVHTVLAPATGPEDFDEVLRLVEESPGVVGALGFHPHEARHLDEGWKRRLETDLERPGIVAVGEIGLDYHYDHSARADQRAALTWQLALARERSLPVVLHQREAWPDFVAALDAAAGVRGVAHSFTEGAEGVAAMVRRGLCVGISGMVTFARADNVRAAAAAAPQSSLLMETDSPFLAPVPWRGRRNEPAYVRHVADAVARVRVVEPAVIEQATDTTFAALFLGRGARRG
jgi:TatD DNase family protein